jgi:NhaP-type Na+/H+ or K+/H+ antiporter
MELLIGVVVGFVLGYGVRSAMSRYRRTRARRESGYPGL